MASAKEIGAAIGDWRAPVPSPRSFYSAFLSEDVVWRSFSDIVNGDEPALVDAEKENIQSGKKSDNVEFSGGFRASSDCHKEVLSGWKPPTGVNGGSIAERRAAKGGFNAPRLNTARFRSISPLSSSSVCSPYLTIPPGLSPTTLLDSPVMLPNSQAQPSPTTGTFPLSPFSHESSMLVPVAFDSIKDTQEDDESSFVFKAHVNRVSMLYLPSVGNQAPSTSNQAKELGMDGVQCLSDAQVQPQVDFECQGGFLMKAMAKDNKMDSPSDLEVSDNMIVPANPMPLQSCPPDVTNDQASQHEEQLHGEDAGSLQLLEGDEKGPFPPMGMGRPSEDGYNWRKYGQKQVKGSVYPRSYYKCTHSNCQVKKKVERSHDGHITEIIYKGTHNHPKPQPSRRTGIGSTFAFNEMPERSEGPGSYVKVEGGSMWRNIQQGSKDKSGMDWNGDGLERTSSTSAVTELSDPLSTSQGKHLGLLESADTPELSSTLASHDDEEDRTTQGSISLGDDAHEEESDSKRRKQDSPLIETNMASRAVREPRVVVQTTSEVDILDDGYRWRKYGQKVVKGNPNPRSYYKCTNAGCTVRKHVERASHDLKSVITTYEGKHNHEVPAARNSSHCNNSGTGSTLPRAHTAITGHSPSSLPKPEPQAQDLAPQFERIPKQLSNEYLRPGYLGNPLGSDIKLGASSACYETKLPPLQTLAFGSFGLNANLKEKHQAASLAQVAPDFPMPFPTSLSHRSASLALADLCFNGKPVGLVQSFLGQQAKECEMRFLRPKEEQEEPVYETPRLPMNHRSNVSSTVYQQIMGGLPM